MLQNTKKYQIARYNFKSWQIKITKYKNKHDNGDTIFELEIIDNLYNFLIIRQEFFNLSHVFIKENEYINNYNELLTKTIDYIKGVRQWKN